jgi:DNA-binding NarL/FixJ family response regulator
MSKTSLLLADDHRIFVDALASYLSREFHLIGTVHDGHALIAAVREHRPKVVITDLSMPGLGGLQAMRSVHAECPSVRFIILTQHMDAMLACEAIRMGASGYVLKTSPADELVSAIHAAVEGRLFVSPLLANEVMAAQAAAQQSPQRRGKHLTPRQWQVLRLVVEGLTMKEVAASLDISPRTVEMHKYEIMHVLGVRTAAELIQHALTRGLIDMNMDCAVIA